MNKEDVIREFKEAGALLEVILFYLLVYIHQDTCNVL
jgi:hypothetical protein